MKNRSVVQHLLGFNAVFDQISRINLRLPQQYRIYIRSEKVWIGGHEDGSSYLHMERISAKALELTQPLAGGDIDITVDPQGHGHEVEAGVVTQKMNCVLRGETLSGLWLRVVFNEDHHYLILLAGRAPEQYPSLREAAMEIAATIRSQIPQPKPKKIQRRVAVEV